MEKNYGNAFQYREKTLWVKTFVKGVETVKRAA